MRPKGPPRGTGPAGEIAALNAKLKRPASASAARKMIDQWIDAAVKVVGGATVASTGASHAGEISAADVKELEAARADQKQALVSFMEGRPAAGLRDWWDQFQGFVPEFLAGAISKRQMKWWKEVVFKVPTDAGELKRELQPPSNVESQFPADAEKLFTWEQLDARLAELTRAATVPVQVPG